jgi:DNA-binding response OmpR family regulator
MGKPAVLIVDEDAAIRALVRAILRALTLDTDEASGGMEAILRIRATHYKCIVLDMWLPLGSGYDVLQAIAADRPDEKFVVVMTAMLPSGIETIDPGNIAAVLRKPFDIENLVAAVRECVGD